MPRSTRNARTKAEEKATVTRNPTLKPEHLDRQGKGAIELQGAISIFKGDYGVRLFLEVKLDDGKVYDFPVKVSGANHIAIEQRAGKNVLGWIGEKFTVHTASFNGQDYIEIDGARKGNSGEDRR